MTMKDEKITGYFEACKDRFNKEDRAWAFTAVVPSDGVNQGQLAVAEFNVGGYTPIWVYFDSYNEAARTADELNDRLGLDKKTAAKIVCSSMRWPAGDRGAM